MSLSRRDFTRLSALGVAAQIAPAFPRMLEAQGNDGKVGYAIIGLGRIADHFMRGIKETDNSRVTALVSGHPDKAAKIAEQYGVPPSSIYNYQNMDEMRSNKDVQAVYVALPNSMHAEYTIRSAKAGKHVLCEKPMATTVGDAEAMIAACKSAHVKLMIAYRCHYETTNLRAVELIRQGAIGQVQQIQSAFGFPAPESGEWRLDRALSGGGPVFDVGIYSLNATRYLTGEEPAEITAYAHTTPNDPRFKTVEENVAWMTRFPSGVVATCNTTYGAPMEGYFHVNGTKGWLHVEPAFVYQGLRLKGEITTGGKSDVPIDEPNDEKDPHQFANEARHFSDCILHNQEPKTAGEEGLQDLKLIRQIYKSAGIAMA